jgi:hypothetical protein
MKRISALCFITLVLPFTVISQTNGICPDSLQTTFINYSEYSFFIAGIDDDQTVSWDFGDGFTAVDDSLISHAFMAGTYLITAIFFDADCPWDGPSLLSTELIVEACGIEISYVETKTGLFTFTAVGIPEEYPMYWDMGDGSQIVETWVVDNIYEPGMYEICAWYYTEFCPDTVEACVEMVYAPDTTCSAEFFYEYGPLDQWGEMYLYTELHALNDVSEWSYIWDFGDGPFEGSANATIENHTPPITQYFNTNICLTTIFGSCADTVCHEVLNCEYGGSIIEFSAFGVQELSAATWELEWLPPFSLDGNLNFTPQDTVHQVATCHYASNYCAAGGLAFGSEIDSIRVRAFYINEVLPYFETIVDNSELLSGLFLGNPDCTSNISEREFAFEVYPTITNNEVMIKGPGQMVFTLYDSKGRICSDGRVLSGEKLSISEFTAGIYLLRVQCGNHSYTVKIVRQD